MHATPDSFRSSQNPLAAYRLHQAPEFIAVLRCRSRFVVGQVRPFFPRLFTDSRMVCFPLAGVLTVHSGLTTLLSLCTGVARPHPRSACYPCAVRAGSVPPGRHRLRQVLESIASLPRGSSLLLDRLRPDFPTYVFPSCLSHLAVPAVDSSHSLAFDSLRRVNSATYSVCTLPLTHSGRVRTPWPPTACARLLHSSRYSVAGAASGRSGPAILASVVHRFPNGLLPPRGRPHR